MLAAARFAGRAGCRADCQGLAGGGIRTWAAGAGPGPGGLAARAPAAAAPSGARALALVLPGGARADAGWSQSGRCVMRPSAASVQSAHLIGDCPRLPPLSDMAGTGCCERGQAMRRRSCLYRDPTRLCASRQGSRTQRSAQEKVRAGRQRSARTLDTRESHVVSEPLQSTTKFTATVKRGTSGGSLQTRVNLARHSCAGEAAKDEEGGASAAQAKNQG